MTSTDWRATWEAAKAAVADFPSFTEATEPGQERPDEDWFHGIAAAEIGEVEARHALQLCRQPLDEVTLAVCAAVQACRDDRLEDFGAALAGHSRDQVIAVLAKLLCSALDDQLGERAAGDPFWRVWSTWAVERT